MKIHPPLSLKNHLSSSPIYGRIFEITVLYYVSCCVYTPGMANWLGDLYLIRGEERKGSRKREGRGGKGREGRKERGGDRGGGKDS